MKTEVEKVFTFFGGLQRHKQNHFNWIYCLENDTFSEQGLPHLTLMV